MKNEMRIAIVGGGPAGLMAAEVIRAAGPAVDVYEGKPSAGRKFLVAGKGGLNLTHSEPVDHFMDRFAESRPHLEPFLTEFGPDELRRWAADLGHETFVGSSGRVFPVGMQAAPLLHAWIARLKAAGVEFHMRHRWLGWSGDGRVRFEARGEVLEVSPGALVLALGGASWPKLGSDGTWVPLLRARGIKITALEPANCGFNIGWSDHLKERFAGEPVKPVVMTFNLPDGGRFRQRGELVVTDYGMEGSLVYAASRWLRENVRRFGQAVVYLDLAPDLEEEELARRLARPRGSNTVSKHLARQAGIRGVKSGLLREVVPADDFQRPYALAAAIKNLPVRLLSTRPIEEAISTAGGIDFDELDRNLMLKKLPGVFCAGEMLDWEAPTGGYLLTASFATGRAAGRGVVDWLENRDSA